MKETKEKRNGPTTRRHLFYWNYIWWSALRFLILLLQLYFGVSSFFDYFSYFLGPQNHIVNNIMMKSCWKLFLVSLFTAQHITIYNKEEGKYAARK